MPGTREFSQLLPPHLLYFSHHAPNMFLIPTLPISSPPPLSPSHHDEHNSLPTTPYNPLTRQPEQPRHSTELSHSSAYTPRGFPPPQDKDQSPS